MAPEQARGVIRCAVSVYARENQPPVRGLVAVYTRENQPPVRGVVAVYARENQPPLRAAAFLPVDEKAARQFRDKAWRELRLWRARYGGLNEFAAVYAEIEKLEAARATGDVFSEG